MKTEIVNQLVKTHLQGNRTVHFHITSTSMYPILVPGDYLVVCGINSKLPKPGAIVIVNSGGRLIAHRLLRWEKTSEGLSLITKGDNVSYLDPAWKLASLWGTASAVIRSGHTHNINTSWARLMSLLIAILSRIQADLYETRLGFIRYIMRAIMQRILVVITFSVFGF